MKTGRRIGRDGDALESGVSVIAHRAPGLFTENGRDIVPHGDAEDGKILVNGPNGKWNSRKVFPRKAIPCETKTFEPFLCAQPRMRKRSPLKRAAPDDDCTPGIGLPPRKRKHDHRSSHSV